MAWSLNVVAPKSAMSIIFSAIVCAETSYSAYLITLKEDAVLYTGFQHDGVEFIYMLGGEVTYRHAHQEYHLKPGDALMFDSGALHGPERLVSLPATYLSIIVTRVPGTEMSWLNFS